MISRYVFIVGSGRSGTSLLRQLLNADPKVALAPETHFLDQWLPRFWLPYEDRATIGSLWPAYRDSAHFRSLELPDDFIDVLGRPPTVSAFFKGMLDVYAEERAATIGGEKTPTHFRYVRQLLNWFPNARIVFIVRDVRATVASLAALDQRWARGTDHKHVSVWRDAAQAALRWKDDSRVEVVRYEDLVEDPVAVLRQLTPKVTGRDFVPTRLMNDVRTDRVDAWAAVVRPSRAEMLLHAVHPLMRELGYTPSEPTPPIAERARFAAGAFGDELRRVTSAVRHPARAIRRIRYRHASSTW
jgi:Sulfotransferase family